VNAIQKKELENKLKEANIDIDYDTLEDTYPRFREIDELYVLLSA